MRYRLDIAYHGLNFHGWQRQPGLRTVQGEIEKWLQLLTGCGDPINLTGAGRTDAGVHAEGMVAHFDSPLVIDTHRLLNRLRVALPNDVVVSAISRVPPDFHARYSAVARTYAYRIHHGTTPFERDRAWQVHGDFDPEALIDASSQILGKHDFSGFCRADSRFEDNTCDVSHSAWSHQGTHWRYEIRADRFLREMVRLLVGTYVAIARGNWPVERVTEILNSRNVQMCGDAAPAHGLTLQRVDYPPPL